MTDDSIVAKEMRARLAARCAAGDLVYSARRFLASAVALADATRAWDPANEREDAMILGAAETIGDLLALAANSSPGLRQLFVDAVAASEPAITPEAAAGAASPRPEEP